MSNPADWLARDPSEPIPDEPHTHGPDCQCDLTTLVADAGGRALALNAGVPYDDLGAVHQGHYRLLASEVYAAMSQALIDLGAVTERTDP